MKLRLQSIATFFLDMTETVVIALSIWLVTYLFLFRATEVMGYSMMPTFHDKDCVITDTISYRLQDPQRFDVTPIHAPPAAHCVDGTGCDFFKRIIGLPGETVEVKDCHYYIDGKKLEEPYIPSDVCTQPGPRSQLPTHLAGDEYFVSGDNRSHSSDSRFFGPIKRSDIIGKAVFRYCPADRVGILSSH